MKIAPSIRLASAALLSLTLFLGSGANGEDAADNPRLLPANQPPGAWTLQWQGKPGRTYFIQNSHDLNTWTYLDTIHHGDGVKMEGVLSTAGKYFLRLRHTDIPCEDPETADFDNDGLNNADELFWLCDPFLPDSDGDGFKDGWEVMAAWNPNQNNSANGHLDPDGDGWDNSTEHDRGTNPNQADSDTDGLSDPDDADPNDATVDWPRAPEASRVWIPLTGYNPATHGAPTALSNTGIALFEKAIWKDGGWLPLEWEKDGPELSYPDPPDAPLLLATTLRGIASLDLADDGRVLGHASLVFDDPHLGGERENWIAVQWTEQGGNMVMEIAGEHVSGGLDLEGYDHLPQAEGVSPEGVIFTRRPTDLLANTWQWGRHGITEWKNPPAQVFASSPEEGMGRLYFGGVWVQARQTVDGGGMGVWGFGSAPNRLLSAAGTSVLPSGDGYVGGALADQRVAFVSFAGDTATPRLRPLGNTGDWRPIPKLAGTAAFNARGEAISHDGRFWQNGEWEPPVSEGSTPPSGTIHLHDLNDHGVMLASAGSPAGGEGGSGLQYGVEAGLVVPMGLLADTNRDGRIDTGDESGKDAFTRQRGAFYNVNFDNDNPGSGPGLDQNSDAILWWMGASGPDTENWEIENAVDVADITPFHLVLPPLPAGSRVYLRVGHQEQRMAAHFFSKREAGQKAFWGGVTQPPQEIWTDGDADPLDIEITDAVLGSQASPEPAGHFEFGLEGLVLRGMPLPNGVGTSGNGSFGGNITLTLEVAFPGQQARSVSKPITMRVAPWLMIPNTAPAEEVFVAGTDHDNNPNTNLQPVLAIPDATVLDADGGPWLQDHVEIGYTQRPGADPIFLTFGTPYYSNIQAETFPVVWAKEKFLAANSGVFTLTNVPDNKGENHGGNIEILPPTPQQPLGSIVVGHGPKHTMSHALRHFLENQEFQPLNTVDVDFASVHHVDEVISVGANGVIYYNDPAMALALLREKFTTVEEKMRGCFFDALGTGKGEHKQLGFRVADPNHTFLILDEAPNAAFAQKFASGAIRTVRVGQAHGGQVARIHAFGAAVAGARPGYPAAVDGKAMIEANGFWHPARSVDPPNWSTPALLPWGDAPAITFQEIWHEASPADTHLLFIEGQPLFWLKDILVARLQSLPAVITVGEVLADQAFVDFNETYVRQKIQAVLGQLQGHTVVPLPALFFKRTSQPPGEPERIYADALTPNPVNMQWKGAQAWLPKQYSASTETEEDIFMLKIKEIIEGKDGTTGYTTGFIEAWNFHVRKGEVHCGSNVRRTPPETWWTKLK